MAITYVKTKEEMENMKNESKNKQEINKDMQKCLNCGIPMEGRKKRYCSKSCNCKHWTKLKKESKNK